MDVHDRRVIEKAACKGESLVRKARWVANSHKAQVKRNQELMEKNKLLRYLLTHHQYKAVRDSLSGQWRDQCIQCGHEKGTPCAKGCSIAVALDKPME